MKGKPIKQAAIFPWNWIYHHYFPKQLSRKLIRENKVYSGD